MDLWGFILTLQLIGLKTKKHLVHWWTMYLGMFMIALQLRRKDWMGVVWSHDMVNKMEKIGRTTTFICLCFLNVHIETSLPWYHLLHDKFYPSKLQAKVNTFFFKFFKLVFPLVRYLDTDMKKVLIKRWIHLPTLYQDLEGRDLEP